MVTRRFSAAIIDAYSSPMTLAPTTISSRAIWASGGSASVSKTRWPSIGRSGTVRRRRAGGDEHVVGGERVVVVFVGDGDTVRIEEPGPAVGEHTPLRVS